jgi:hypothetical protein
MKILSLLFFSLSFCAIAQTSSTAAAAPAPANAAIPANSPLSTTVTQTQQIQLQTTVNTANLPGITVGVGPAWNRGAANPYAVDTTVAVRLGAASNTYSWTDITTPVVQPGTTQSAPVQSSVTTGLGYVLAQNKSGSVSLIGIGQTGFAVSSGGVSPSFTGSLAAAFKLGSHNIWAIPYFKAGNASLGSNGSVASFVMQPGVQFVVGLGK